MRRWFAVPAALLLGFASVHGCGLEFRLGGWGYDCLDPEDPDYNEPNCIARRCRENPSESVCDGGTSDEDAGAADGESSSDGGSSARCSGTCVQNAPDFFAKPQLVYVGPTSVKYAYGCPSEVGAFGGRLYRDLTVPAPGCPTCSCGPIDGSCSARPNTIIARAGSCDVQEPATTNFAAPDDWDGSCTNINAIPAGLECPPGSGISCAQSIFASSLLEPVEGCEPIPLPVPNATSDAPSWTKMVLSCNPSELQGACEAAASTMCLPSLPSEPGWRYCVRAKDKGVSTCPSGSVFSKQIIAYADYIDTRKCTECECKAAGGSCHGIFRIYSDDSCSTNELAADLITSNMTVCANVNAGEAIGSKELTDLAYVPGKCEPIAGLPSGTAYPDESTAVTWCCMPSPDDANLDTNSNMK